MEEEKIDRKLLMQVLPTGIVIRVRGDVETCSCCSREFEVFGREAGSARFLMIRLENVPSLGGGKCPLCEKTVCIACSTKTVYGAGVRRLHCPTCGSFLVGIKYEPSHRNLGAFLEDLPEFSSRSVNVEQTPPENLPEK